MAGSSAPRAVDAPPPPKQRVLPWGPPTWHAIHYIALGYPSRPDDDDRATYRAFFELLGRVLPCKLCTGHYAENLKQLPLEPHLESPERLFEWTVLLHNNVNRAAGKREWSVAEAREFYLHRLGAEEKGGRVGGEWWYIVCTVLLVSLAVVGAWVVLAKRRGK